MTRRKLLQNQRRAQRTRLRTPRLFLEMLEDRTLLSGGQWLVDISGLPGNTRQVQMAAAQQLFQQDGVDPNLQVVNHFGANGVLLVQAPTSYTQQMVARGLAPIMMSSGGSGTHAIVDVEAYDPDKDPGSYNVAFPPPIDPDEFQPVSPPTSGGGSSAPLTGNPPSGGPSGGPLTVNPVNGFVGIKGGQSGGFIPPDSDGAVGPNSFIAAANLAIGAFDKVTGNPIAGGAVESLGTFFAPLGGVLSLSDPVVVYNEITGKFFVESLDFNTSNQTRLDVAISKTSNPTLNGGDWNFFRYDVNDHTGANFDFADYPKVGYNADGYVVSFNMFPNLAFFDHVSTISIRNDGTSPGIHVVSGGFSNFTLAPAAEHGAASGAPMWFVQDGHGGGGGSTISVVREDDPFGAQSFNFFTLSVNAYGNAVNTTQPNGGSIAMGGLGTRFYFSDMRTVSGTTHLVSSDTIGAGGGDRARWYDLTISGGVPSVFQQGDIAPVVSSSSTYLPTIAIAPNGNLGVNFAESGLNEFLSMYVTGRAPTDVLNSMQTPVLAKAGDANLDNPQRIGDYSEQTIDPVDGSFWGVNEFASNSNGFPNWGTWVEHYNINGASPPPPASPGAITGRVFNDPLHNGVDNPSDPGLPGWLVYIDVKHTGQFDPSNDPYQITDASGSYTFNNVKPGTYFVGEVLWPTYVESTPVSVFGEHTVNVPSGTTVTKVDFGDYSTSAQVLIDDADTSNFHTNGGDWDPNNPNGFNGGSHTNPNFDPTQNAQWTVTTGKGRFELFATWANDTTFDPNATYKIFDGTTSGTLLGTVTENQVLAPYQANINGGFWNKLGTFTTTTGTYTIELVADGNDHTIDADAVFAAQAPASANVAVVHVGTDETGEFGAVNAVNFLKTDSRFTSVADINVDVTGIPTAAQLAQYSAVLVVTDNRDGIITGGGKGTQLGNVLHTYHQNGGRVILSAFDGSTTIGIDGGILADSPATLIAGFNGAAGSMSVPATHPFPFGGVNSFSSTYDNHIGKTASGIDVANYFSGEFGVLTTADNSVMFVNAFPFDQFDYGNGTQFGLLFANALAGSNPAVAAPTFTTIVGSTTSSSNGGAGNTTPAPMTASSATNAPSAPTGLAGNASTPSVNPLDNLFMSMGNGNVVNPVTAPMAASSGNTPTITGAAFNTFMTSLSKSASTDLVPGDGGDGNAPSQDPLL